MMMATCHWMLGYGAIRPDKDAVRSSTEAIFDAERTLLRRRAGSKPAVRVGDGGHEVSKAAKNSCAGVKRSTTRIAFPQRGQCQGAQSGRGLRDCAEAEESMFHVPVRRAACAPGAAAVCGSGWITAHSGGCARTLWAAHAGRSGTGSSPRRGS